MGAVAQAGMGAVHGAARPSAAPVRVAINGFGRIGRSILRAALTTRAESGLDVAAINDVAAPELCAHLFAFDSVFGPLPGGAAFRDGALEAAGRRVPFTTAPDVGALDLSGVDVLLECTGHAAGRAALERGLDAGAASVLVSGPHDDADATLVLGANDAALGRARIVSNASCTTNALAPLLALLDRAFGLRAAHFTTVHCYTGSQPVVDAPRGDPLRSRAAALSMVPTTTSATRVLGAVLPDLAARVTGASIRVPVASVSAIDLVVALNDRTDVDRRLADAIDASPVLERTALPLVSTDLRARPASLVLAEAETRHGPELTRLLGWYDNEWGFSNRMIDVALRMAAAAREGARDVA